MIGVTTRALARRRVTLGVAALVAVGLGGCLPDTLTPLRATDGEPPPGDHGPLLDETVRDIEPSDADLADDGDPFDTSRDIGADGSPDAGTHDTDGDTDGAADDGLDGAPEATFRDRSPP